MVLRSPYIGSNKFGTGCKEGYIPGNSRKLIVYSGNDRQHRLTSKGAVVFGMADHTNPKR